MNFNVKLRGQKKKRTGGWSIFLLQIGVMRWTIASWTRFECESLFAANTCGVLHCFEEAGLALWHTSPMGKAW